VTSVTVTLFVTGVYRDNVTHSFRSVTNVTPVTMSVETNRRYAMDAIQKPCALPGCPGVLEKRERDGRRWESRQYCSISCSRKASKGRSYIPRPKGQPVNRSAEYIMPADFRSLTGYHSTPPPQIADGVRARMMRGAIA